MKIDKSTWEAFNSHLIIEEKFSDKRGAVSANKSRFLKLVTLLDEKDFNRANFGALTYHLKEIGAAPHTINNIIKIAKKLDIFLKINQIQDFSYYKEGTIKDVDVLSPEEMFKIAEISLKYRTHSKFINQRQKALGWLMATTGCRIGEALNLRPENIKTGPYRVRFWDTKTNKDRIVPIGEDIYKMLQQIKPRKGMIFYSWRGGEINEQQLNLDWKKRAQICGIKKNIYNHLFRHSFITLMLEMGVSDSDIMHIVGHVRHETLMRYKHSLVNYYVDVVHMNPLLRKNLPFEFIKSKAREQIERLVGRDYRGLSIIESNNELIIKLKDLSI